MKRVVGAKNKDSWRGVAGQRYKGWLQRKRRGKLERGDKRAAIICFPLPPEQAVKAKDSISALFSCEIRC